MPKHRFSTDSTDSQVPFHARAYWRHTEDLCYRYCRRSGGTDTIRRRLAEGITEACAEIDARLGNRPGTAERGCYFWYWPPDPNLGIDVLAALYRDAVAARDFYAARYPAGAA